MTTNVQDWVQWRTGRATAKGANEGFQKNFPILPREKVAGVCSNFKTRYINTVTLSNIILHPTPTSSSLIL